MKIEYKKDARWGKVVAQAIITSVVVVLFFFMMITTVNFYFPEPEYIFWEFYIVVGIFMFIFMFIVSACCYNFNFEFRFYCQRCYNKFYEKDMINIIKKDVKNREDLFETWMCKNCLEDLKKK